jgi:ribosomal-protein-alanine N-acetyltransferase
MQFTFRPLQWYDVNSIYYWRYDGLYARYNGNALNLQPYVQLRLLNKWMGYECFAVEDEQRLLVGYFTFTKHTHRTVEIGLALRPDLTGRGYGLAFVESGLAFGKQRYRAKRFLLTVADFNLRAMKVYTRAGFLMVKPITKQTAQGAALFYEMQRDA